MCEPCDECTDVSPEKAERWWILHDQDLRDTLLRVERGSVTAQEAYAILCEHASTERVGPSGE